MLRNMTFARFQNENVDSILLSISIVQELASGKRQAKHFSVKQTYQNSVKWVKPAGLASNKRINKEAVERSLISNNTTSCDVTVDILLFCSKMHMNLTIQTIYKLSGG